MTNKPASDLDLSTIKKYLKSVQNVIPESIESPHLPKFKSYMKIIGLPYLSELEVLSPDYIEGILVKSHLFKDATLASKPRIIKGQFNIGQFITTIHRTNMNPGVPQCKNCWK